jgi:hypothetical protein
VQELIGTSSILRELTALRRAVKHVVLTQVVRGKVIRVNMDSAAGIANLVKGGGPKAALCRLVKEWFHTCEDLSIRPVYRWVSRETPQLRVVDALSKSSQFCLTVEGERRLRQELGRGVLVVDFGKLGMAINFAQAATAPLSIVVPRWEAKPWWPVVATLATVTPCPGEFISLSGAAGREKPGWQFVVATFGGSNS